MGSGKAAEKQTQAFGQLPRRFEVVPDGMNAEITSICTPHFRHFDDIMCALNYGHVIAEKPMCASLWECDRLEDRQIETGHHIFPVFNHRYADHSPFEDSIVIEVKRTGDYWTRGWRSRWEESLGGTVAMHGVHGLDLIVEKYGMPTALQGKIWGSPKIKVETRAVIAMQWASGHMCTLGVAADGEVGLNDEACYWSLGDPLDGYRRLFERIWLNLNPVRGGEVPPPVPSLQDGRNSVELLTAVYKSFLIDQWVPVPVPSDDFLYSGWAEQCSKWYGQPEPPSLACH